MRVNGRRPGREIMIEWAHQIMPEFSKMREDLEYYSEEWEDLGKAYVEKCMHDLVDFINGRFP